MNADEQPKEQQEGNEGTPLSPSELRRSFTIIVLVTLLILLFACVVFNITPLAAGVLSLVLAGTMLTLVVSLVQRLSIPIHSLMARETVHMIGNSLNDVSHDNHKVLAAIAVVPILFVLSSFAFVRDRLPVSESTQSQPTVLGVHTPTTFSTHSAILLTPSPTPAAIQTVTATLTPTPQIMFKRKPTPTPDLVANLASTQTPLLRNPTLIRPRVLIADVRHVPSKDARLVGEEYILLVNFDQTVDITGWSASLDSGEIYRFNNQTMTSGSFARLYTVAGPSVSKELFWNLGSPLWKRTDYHIILRDSSGLVIDQFEHMRRTASRTPTVSAMP